MALPLKRFHLNKLSFQIIIPSFSSMLTKYLLKTLAVSSPSSMILTYSTELLIKFYFVFRKRFKAFRIYNLLLSLTKVISSLFRVISSLTKQAYWTFLKYSCAKTFVKSSGSLLSWIFVNYWSFVDLCHESSLIIL